MEKVVIKLEPNDSLEMEKAWYLYNAGLSIIKELMHDHYVDFEVLQEYIDVTESRWYLTEKKKEELGKMYIPNGWDLTKCNYSFDFQDETITFEKVK